MGDTARREAQAPEERAGRPAYTYKLQMGLPVRLCRVRVLLKKSWEQDQKVRTFVRRFRQALQAVVMFRRCLEGDGSMLGLGITAGYMGAAGAKGRGCFCDIFADKDRGLAWGLVFERSPTRSVPRVVGRHIQGLVEN